MTVTIGALMGWRMREVGWVEECQWWCCCHYSVFPSYACNLPTPRAPPPPIVVQEVGSHDLWAVGGLLPGAPPHTACAPPPHQCHYTFTIYWFAMTNLLIRFKADSRTVAALASRATAYALS